MTIDGIGRLVGLLSRRLGANQAHLLRCLGKSKPLGFLTAKNWWRKIMINDDGVRRINVASSERPMTPTGREDNDAMGAYTFFTHAEQRTDVRVHAPFARPPFSHQQ
jgi:hypothetical protein